MKHLISKLLAGETVTFKPRGNSMTPRIYSGDLVTVSPITPETHISIGDIVFCKVKGNVYLHLVKGIRDSRYLIGNNHGHINGWTSNVYGVLT
jgi:phage repressor protein C with HTH and peptisase S24 domain